MSEPRQPEAEAVSRCDGFRHLGCPPPNQAADMTVSLIMQNGWMVRR